MNETRNIIASLEFGEKESQICYYDRKEKNPVSLAVKTGTTEYTFPTRLSKRPKTNIWHFGAESEYFSKYEGETLVEDVLNLCMKGEPVEIDGEFHEVEELLEVFLKGCLSMLGVGEPQRQIKILMITTPNLNRVFIRKLQKVCRYLNFANGQVLIQDYNESFYYYAMRTRHDNANRSTGLFCFDKNRVHFRKLWIDTATKPMIARVEVGKSELLSENPKKRDKRFAEMIEKCCGEESYSNLYLIGEGFDKEWTESLFEYGQGRVTYNNLPPGEYVFRVSVAGNDRMWGAESKFVIVIHPPFWDTLAARILYAILVLFLLFGLMHLVNRRNHRRMIRMQQEEAQKKKERLSSLSINQQEPGNRSCEDKS